MRKLKLKKYVLPTTVLTLGLLSMATAVILPKNESLQGAEHLNYVSNTILSGDLAVLNTTQNIIYPYTDQSVRIGKSYYDYKGDQAEQEKSIIYHENTYIQNSGVDFVYENSFSINSILDGTVSVVKEDEILGKIVEVTHDNDYVSVYQSLSEVTVKKGDKVTQGQIIGTSGTNQLDKELGNHLHFELYIGGQIVRPTDYLGKEMNSKQGD